MRRSGYPCCLPATFLVSPQPDAAYVPAKRSVAATNARGTATAPRTMLRAVSASAISFLNFVAGTTPAGFTLPSTFQQITVAFNP